MKKQTVNSPPLSKEDLHRVRKIQLKMDHIATDLLAGMYRSRFKGRGMEFEEVREFQQGDEVRSVDWNVTARMGTPFVKLFREERELTVILLVDISASMRFGSRNQLKSTILSEIGAGLAFSGIKNQDKIGLILYSDHVEHYLPPVKGVRHVLRLIRDIIAFPVKGKGTNLENALNFLGKVQKKEAVIFLLSDFLSEDNKEAELRAIARKHDLIAIAVQDPLEKHLPNVGLLPILDLETGNEELIDTGSTSLNSTLSESFGEHLKLSKKQIEKSGGSWVQVRTDVPYLGTLRKFFMQKRKM